MSPRVFLTGASGYIGGHVLYNLSSKHPDYHIMALVRTEDQAKIIARNYPALSFAIGDLDSEEILTKESKEADVVIAAADSDHTASIKSLIKGLALGSKNGVLIQVSGAASVIDSSNGIGQPTSKIWDDIEDLHEISTFDHSIVHAISDQIVIQDGKSNGIRTALVIPPCVYGAGKGPIKTRGIGLPSYIEAVTDEGKAFIIGEGKQISSSIHVQDLVSSIVFLTEQALQASSGIAKWGVEGLYYVEGGSFEFVEFSRAVGKEMHKRGLIPSSDVEEISAEKATTHHPWGPIMWGSSMRVRASRLRSLGWTAQEPKLLDTIGDLLD